jgi:hypothetical protein
MYLESLIESDEEIDLQLAQNHEWLRRFEIIELMSNWIRFRLKRKGKYDKRPRSDNELRIKAKDYLYAHIMQGKMLFPQGRDPLFCDERFENSTLIEQFRGGYADFIDFVRKINYLRREHKCNTEKYNVAVDRLRRNVHVQVMQQLFKSLPLDTEDALKTVLIDGLLLRYACIGALWSNLHGSVPLDTYSEDYIECFASPFNRRMENYYSIFEEDSEYFGSKGNFFQMVAQNGGILTQNQKYEINPPFDLDLMVVVAKIIDKTFRARKPNITVCAFFPNWRDAKYVMILDALVRAASTFFTAKRTAVSQTYNDAQSHGFGVQTIVYEFRS